jgi:lon-related putative ATP-dependent protease
MKKNKTLALLASREKELPAGLKLTPTQRAFRRLSAEEVFRSWTVDEKLLHSKELADPHYDIISQERAKRAISLGLGVSKSGYNIYVAGVQGTGKTSVIRSFLKKTAEKQKSPLDWVYVYNFKNPEHPRAIQLPTGKATLFKKQMDELVDELSSELPGALQSEEYENKVNSTVNESNERKAKLFAELEKISKKMNFGVKSTRMGIVTVPIVDGKPLSEKEYGELSNEQKEQIETERNKLEPEVLDFARKVRAIESETKERLESLRREVGDYVVDSALDPILKVHKKNKTIVDYLSQVKGHILENLSAFLRDDDEDGEEDNPVPVHMRKGDAYLPYRINVFVDHTDTRGAPIVIETNPTFYNLFGKIEKNIEYGIYTTDFKMIKAGSAARANGGYLVLEALEVLRNPQVWDTMKRTLKDGKLYIEDLGEQYSLLPTSGLRPEPIPLNVKIILVGSDWIYRMLYLHDEDFNKIFKIKADFDAEMPVTNKTVEDYVHFVSTRSKVDNLLAFDAEAMAAVLEFGARIVSDQERLTTRFSLVKDLCIEADFMAKERNSKRVSRQDVEKAIEERYHRSSLVEDHIGDMINRGDILLSTATRRVGEINGLAVYNMGDFSFGVPSRITCRTYAGKPGIVNIERDAALSGRIHNKGVGILTSWINATFGQKDLIYLSASLCFEQNYSGVDGDSASLAELCLILSTVGEIPIDQSIAVTGSVNQFGEVQPIGGVIEKIEGFFKVCTMQGLTGRQGCIIPVQNMKHLLLSRDVREAIEKEQFHIWPVSSVEDAFELLTGFEAGGYDPKTHGFPRGSAFHHIHRRLLTKPGEHKKKTHGKKDREKESAAKRTTSKRAVPTKKSPQARKKPTARGKGSSKKKPPVGKKGK